MWNLFPLLSLVVVGMCVCVLHVFLLIPTADTFNFGDCSIVFVCVAVGVGVVCEFYAMHLLPLLLIACAGRRERRWLVDVYLVVIVCLLTWSRGAM